MSAYYTALSESPKKDIIEELLRVKDKLDKAEAEIVRLNRNNKENLEQKRKQEEIKNDFYNRLKEVKEELDQAQPDAERFRWLAANSVGVDNEGIGWSHGNKIETIRELVDSRRNLELKILHSPDQTIHIITKEALDTNPLR